MSESWEVVFDNDDLSNFAAQFPVMVADALTKTAEKAKELLIERVTKIYNVPTGLLTASNIKVVPAKQTLESQLVLSGKEIPLIKFGAIPSASGVTYQVKLNEGPKILPHAFEARMPGSGHIGIFQRTGKFKFAQMGRYAGKTYQREVIAEERRLSVASMIWSNELYALVEDDVTNFFEDEINRLTDAQFQKRAA